jgi:hypothetical protein
MNHVRQPLTAGPSLPVPTRLLFNDAVSPGSRLLAVILAALCLARQKSTLSFPSYQFLADEIRFTHEQVATYSQELGEAGWITLVSSGDEIIIEVL